MRVDRRSALGLALFLLLCFGAFLYLYHLSGGSLGGGGDAYRVQALVPDAQGLAAHADVRAAGVKVGEVESVRAAGNVSALRLAIEREHAPVYRDARVLVRIKSIAGEAYLELEPGRPQAGALRSGGTLALDRAQEATQIDQILSVLDRGRRRQLQRALAGLGGGLAGRGGDLNRLAEGLSGAVGEAAPVIDTLAEERAHVAGLVDSFGRVTRALGERRDAIRLFVRRARTTARAVADRDAALRAALGELPSFLRQTRATGTRLQTFAAGATPVVADLRAAVQDLVPAVRELRPSAAAGRRTIRALDRFAVATRPALARLRPFATAAALFVPPLAASLRQVNPLLAYLAPYWRELSSFLGQVGAGTAYTDATGHMARVVPLLSRSALPGTLSERDEAALTELTGKLGEKLDTRGVNAYPAPGEAGLSSSFSGTYPRLRPDPPYAPAGG